jgi:hypothetical protein
MNEKVKKEKGASLRRQEVKTDGKSRLYSPGMAIELELGKAFRNLYKAVRKNVIKQAVALELAKERGRMRPYLKEALEVLANAQGEWASVTETYAPLETHPLKEAISLIKKALAGKARKAAEEKALTAARVSFAYDTNGKIRGVLVPNFNKEGEYFEYQFEPDEYEEVNHEEHPD